MSDRELLEIYMRGFTDELDGLSARPYEGTKLSAYTLGRNHAFIGDDVSSIDLLTNEEILEMIRKIDRVR